jgi:hypothetical protein
MFDVLVLFTLHAQQTISESFRDDELAQWKGMLSCPGEAVGVEGYLFKFSSHPTFFSNPV